MVHPDTLAELAKERRNTMLAEAAAARLARETRRQRGHVQRPYRKPWSASPRRLQPSIARRSASGPVPLTEAVMRIVPWLAGLPSASGPHRPATVAAREKGSKA
jgi:hypothetical protein